MRTGDLFRLLALLTLPLTACVSLPDQFEAVVWEAPEPPALEGVFAPNERLAEAEVLLEAGAAGPEDVDVDTQGRIYAGTTDGRIVRIDGEGAIETFAATGGRPGGMDFDAEENLIVAVGEMGLVSINPEGEIESLVDALDGEPLGLINDVDVGPDGIIYFSESTSKYPPELMLYEVLEASPNGRVLAYDPKRGETRVVLDNVHYANGVAVSPTGDFLLVNETSRYRTLRLWLTGPDAGRRETFLENLPGFPDGVSTGEGGIFWLALYTKRSGLLDYLHRHPCAKRMLGRLSPSMWPQPPPYGFVLGVDAEGEIRFNLQDPDGETVRTVTSVEESGDHLYFGTLFEERITRLRRPTAE